jgi:hypothetical protein
MLVPNNAGQRLNVNQESTVTKIGPDYNNPVATITQAGAEGVAYLIPAFQKQTFFELVLLYQQYAGQRPASGIMDHASASMKVRHTCHNSKK